MSVLLKFEKDWADEFDAEGFIILTLEQVCILELIAKDYPDTKTSFYFGTNEGWDDITLKELMDHTIRTPISKQEHDTLAKLFPACVRYGYGQMWDSELFFYEEDERIRKLADKFYGN